MYVRGCLYLKLGPHTSQFSGLWKGCSKTPCLSMKKSQGILQCAQHHTQLTKSCSPDLPHVGLILGPEILAVNAIAWSPMLL